ncbi:restriction endonuclease subunit S [Mycetocola zhadangensis]|uniref:restriction endonuclease subunit S n=1 Tax=Mycetocola zhadangensis TaxID=1164595 RepID=UPI003A4DF345
MLKPLSDVVHLQRGFDLPHHARREGHHPVLTSGETGGFHDEGPIVGPGLTVGRATNLGKPKWSDVDFWPHNTTMFVKDFFGNEPRWVFHLFENTDLAGYDSGSVQPMLNRNYIAKVPVAVPPRQEQRAIAEVLRALDDKISANTKLVDLLGENLAVTFTAIAGDLVGSVPFSALATVTKGVSYRSVDLVESTTALVTLKSFDRNGGYSARGLKGYAGAYKLVQRIHPGELVVAQTDLTQAAEVVGRAMRVPSSSRHDTLVASLDLAIVRPVAGVPQEFLLGVMLQGRFREHCRSRTSGTTVLHLASDALPTFMAPNVSPEVQQRYASVASPMLEMGDSVTRESESLAALRDTLLPQLMSGKLRVKDAEETLEGAL